MKSRVFVSERWFATKNAPLPSIMSAPRSTPLGRGENKFSLCGIRISALTLQTNRSRLAQPAEQLPPTVMSSCLSCWTESRTSASLRLRFGAQRLATPALRHALPVAVRTDRSQSSCSKKSAISPKPIHHEEHEGHEGRKRNRHRAILLHELQVLHGLVVRSKSTSPVSGSLQHQGRRNGREKSAFVHA